MENRQRKHWRYYEQGIHNSDKLHGSRLPKIYRGKVSAVQRGKQLISLVNAPLSDVPQSQWTNYDYLGVYGWRLLPYAWAPGLSDNDRDMVTGLGLSTAHGDLAA